MTTFSKWGGTRSALQRAEDRQAAETVPAAGPAPVAPAAVPEPGTPEHIEALADAETAQAARDLEAIEERVINGDESVTPEQVEQVRGLARFAHLRREAAARKAGQVRQAAVDETYRQRAAEVAAELHAGISLDDIAGLALDVEASVRALLDVCARREDVINRGAVRLAGAGQSTLADQHDGDVQQHAVKVDGVWHRRSDAEPTRILMGLVYDLTRGVWELSTLNRLAAAYEHRGAQRPMDAAIDRARAERAPSGG